MPDPSGAPTLQELAALSTGGFAPFVTGPLGQSGLTQAATNAFVQNTLPVIQNQMALQGLGSSPALGQNIGQSLATALPQFIQADLSNRLAAAQGLQGQQHIGQQGASLAAQIANQEAMRGLQAAGQAGNIFGGLASGVFNPMAQLQQQQWQQALAGFGSAGQLQQGITQEQIDKAMMDFLRLQGLAEAGTTGIFGGAVLPPTLQQSTSSSGGK